MYATGQLLAASIIVLTVMSVVTKVLTIQSEPMSAPVAGQDLGSLAPFRSVELRNGGKLILRHGPLQRVTLLQGSLDYTQVTITNGDRLVIDKCKTNCPRGYDLELEIVTPDIARISIGDGGIIQSRGSFPRQTEMGVAVSQGGTIDVRSIVADSVSASVAQGGRILIKPQNALSASIVDGGIITYWGDARVTSSIQRGGDVTKGTAAEADQPLSEFGPLVPAVPPIPPLPSIQPRRDFRK